MTIRPLEPEHAAQLCEWVYEPPYAIYNWPPWEQMQKDGIEFGDPVLRTRQYSAVVNEAHELIGFVQMFPMAGVTRLGLGLRPDLCGRGLGSRLARLAAEEAQRREPGHQIDLEVLSWNRRAIRAYERAGFRTEDIYPVPGPNGPEERHCMVFAPDPPSRPS